MCSIQSSHTAERSKGIEVSQSYLLTAVQMDGLLGRFIPQERANELCGVNTALLDVKHIVASNAPG